jgi:hypothetical protein
VPSLEKIDVVVDKKKMSKMQKMDALLTRENYNFFEALVNDPNATESTKLRHLIRDLEKEHLASVSSKGEHVSITSRIKPSIFAERTFYITLYNRSDISGNEMFLLSGRFRNRSRFGYWYIYNLKHNNYNIYKLNMETKDLVFYNTNKFSGKITMLQNIRDQSFLFTRDGYIWTLDIHGGLYETKLAIERNTCKEFHLIQTLDFPRVLMCISVDYHINFYELEKFTGKNLTVGRGAMPISYFGQFKKAKRAILKNCWTRYSHLMMNYFWTACQLNGMAKILTSYKIS